MGDKSRLNDKRQQKNQNINMGEDTTSLVDHPAIKRAIITPSQRTLHPNVVAQLQRSHGNKFVQNLVQRMLRNKTQDLEEVEKEDSEETEKIKLANHHLGKASNDEYLRKHMGHIKNGAFTSKKDQRGHINVDELKLKQVINNVEDFYDYAEELIKTKPETIKSGTITLYRAVYTTYKKDSILEELLPSSTSWSLEFVKGWAKNRDKNYCIIFEITVPITHQMLILSYPTDFKGKKKFEEINDTQAEVTLGPTQLMPNGQTRVDDGFNIVPVKAKSIEKKEIGEKLQDDLKNRGNDLEIKDMFIAFEKFVQFFSFENLKKLLEKETKSEDYKSNQKIDENYYLLEINKDDSKDTWSVEIIFDNFKGTIQTIIKETIFDSETSEKEEYRYNSVYNKKNIGNIYTSLMSLNLMTADNYESLNFPMGWYKALNNENIEEIEN